MHTGSKLYHNTRCSKSRAALELLRDSGVQPRILDYLASPPSSDELRELLRLLGTDARGLMRRGEEAYAALGLGDPAVGEPALVAAMTAHPELIERPIFVHEGRAVIGRPPERVLEIL